MKRKRDNIVEPIPVEERIQEHPPEKEIDDSDAPITWKKTGGGSLRIGGRIIKPNQKFQAKPSEVPKAFRDIVIPMDALPEERPVNYVASEFAIVATEGGKFNITNLENKVLNENPLSAEEANKMLKEMAQ